MLSTTSCLRHAQSFLMSSLFTHASSFKSSSFSTNSQSFLATPPKRSAKLEVSSGDETNFDDDFRTQLKKPVEGDDLYDTLEDLYKKIEKDANSCPIVVFMKGTAIYPGCGYSKLAIDLLNMYGYEYKTFDVMKDIIYKEALKEWSKFPTIPQIFVKGELIGGADILLGMHKEEPEELRKMLKESGSKEKFVEKKKEETKNNKKSTKEEEKDDFDDNDTL